MKFYLYNIALLFYEHLEYPNFRRSGGVFVVHAPVVREADLRLYAGVLFPVHSQKTRGQLPYLLLPEPVGCQRRTERGRWHWGLAPARCPTAAVSTPIRVCYDRFKDHSDATMIYCFRFCEYHRKKFITGKKNWSIKLKKFFFSTSFYYTILGDVITTKLVEK